MSDNTSALYTAKTRKRFIRIFGGIAIVAVLILAPLIINASLRWELAHELGWITGQEVEQVYGPDSGKTLITIPIMHRVHSSKVEERFWAAYLGESVDNAYQLTSLDTDTTIAIPLPHPDFLAASDDGSVLFLKQTGFDSVVLSTQDGTWQQLPPGQVPAAEGNWTRSIYATRIGRSCTGISPNAVYIACFDQPILAKYLFGDWQLEVSKYGNYQLNAEIYRGLGTQPVFGFTRNDAWLWFQNEEGIWREPMSLDLF